MQLFSVEQLDHERSHLLDKLTPQYRVGDCYPKACLGQAEVIRHLEEQGDWEEAHEWQFNTLYVQGWFIRQFRDNGAVDAFAHGFLVRQLEDRLVVIDGLAEHYGSWTERFWLPVQQLTFLQVDRWIDSDAEKHWPLTTRADGNALEDRLGYQRALEQATTTLRHRYSGGQQHAG